MELLHLNEAMGLAVYDSPAWRGIPAACCSRFGKGQAAYFGCYSEEGFEPYQLDQAAGRTAKRDLHRGEMLKKEDVE